jgi:hypothetical protein
VVPAASFTPEREEGHDWGDHSQILRHLIFLFKKVEIAESLWRSRHYHLFDRAETFLQHT